MLVRTVASLSTAALAFSLLGSLQALELSFWLLQGCTSAVLHVSTGSDLNF